MKDYPREPVSIYIVRPKLGVLPTNISLRVAGENQDWGKESLLKASHVKGGYRKDY